MSISPCTTAVPQCWPITQERHKVHAQQQSHSAGLSHKKGTKSMHNSSPTVLAYHTRKAQSPCTTAVPQCWPITQERHKVHAQQQSHSAGLSHKKGTKSTQVLRPSGILLTRLNEEPRQIRHQHLTHQVITTCIVTHML